MPASEEFFLPSQTDSLRNFSAAEQGITSLFAYQQPDSVAVLTANLCILHAVLSRCNTTHNDLKPHLLRQTIPEAACLWETKANPRKIRFPMVATELRNTKSAGWFCLFQVFGVLFIEVNGHCHQDDRAVLDREQRSRQSHRLNRVVMDRQGEQNGDTALPCILGGQDRALDRTFKSSALIFEGEALL